MMSDETEYKELLIGCGNRRDRLIEVDGRKGWTDLTTLDVDLDCGADVVWNLDNGAAWPFDDNTFDEIHAYEVLEHLGQQGDYPAFFWDFGQAWRVLKPGGVLCATVPWWQSEWAWGDPGHRRIITPASLVFLDQSEYERQVGQTAMSDYRAMWTGDFRRLWMDRRGESFWFTLQAVKADVEAEG